MMVRRQQLRNIIDLDPVINEILEAIKVKYNITKSEAERILDSQFKVVLDHTESGNLKTINLMHLGKIGPTKTYKKRHGEF